MKNIKQEEVKQELEVLRDLVDKLGLTKELVINLTRMGYELYDLGTSWKCGNQSGEVIDFEVKGKKYLSGHFIGVGCGCKMVGKASNGFQCGIYQGFVKQVV